MTLQLFLAMGLGAFLAALGWMAWGKVSEGYRSAARANVRLSELESLAHQIVGSVDQLRGRNGNSAALSDLATRMAALEKNVAQMDLEVLDVAEKVAARLSDRERKRRATQEDSDDLDDEASAMARARAAFPLPSLFPES